MPFERTPTPQSHTTISIGSPSEDENSERSDNLSTVEVVRSVADQESVLQTPSVNTEDTDCSNVSRHRTTPNGEDNEKYASNEIPDIPLERKKSNGISKGVILNAMNFGSYDLKCTPKDLKEESLVPKDQELLENGSPSSKALEASAENNQKAAEAENSEEKKMSIPRKIAFGFSFLPSVMFVLAFAVILPCEEYKTGGQCATWSLLLNQTEITSDYSLPESLLLGYEFMNSSGSFEGIINLNQKVGKEIWSVPLDSFPKSFECQNFDADVNEDGVKDCFAILDNGNVCAFNLSDGSIFWTFQSSEANNATIVFSGCHYDDSKAVAVVQYDGRSALRIDLLQATNGSLLISRKVKLAENCVIFNMKYWQHDNETDVVFFCKNGQGIGYIQRIKQSLWCPPVKEGDTENLIQLMRLDESEIDPTYLTTPDGILIWTSNQIISMQPNGVVRWKDDTSNILQNRILKFGSFYGEYQQVVSIGQNSSDIEVAFLTSENGEQLQTFSVSGRTLNEVHVLQRNDSSVLLLTVLSMTNTEKLPDKEVVVLSNVSDYQRNIPYKGDGKQSITEELILFQLEGKNKTHVILESKIPFSCINGVCGPQYEASHIISTSSEEKEKLNIVMLRIPDHKSQQNGSQYFSQLNAFRIVYQDNSDSEQTACTL